MSSCHHCTPCVVREPIRRRCVVTPLSDGNGWLWHVIPRRTGTRNWGEAESREEAIKAGEIYIQTEGHLESQI